MVVTVVCSHDEYTVERERAGALENCYVSVLVIHSAGRGGAGSGPRGRQFSLRLENEHGAEIHRATVTMGEELSTQTLIGRQQYTRRFGLYLVLGRERGGGGRHLPAGALPRHLLVPQVLQGRETAQAGPREVICLFMTPLLWQKSIHLYRVMFLLSPQSLVDGEHCC